MPETMVTMNCHNCSRDFEARAVVVRTKGRPYCSPRCSQKGRTRPVTDRLEDLSVYEPNSGCRLFLGALDRDGYGLLTTAGRTEPAHKAAYRDEVGDFDSVLDLDHLCRNRACINVRHLEPVTHQVNCLRGMSPMAIVVRTGVCKNGHVLAEVGSYGAKNGRRFCRACATENSRRYRRRLKERT